MNKLGLRITNNGREAYVVNPNHNWELHTVDFNACLLALDNLDDGDGLIILSHDSGGCYLGIVQLLKQGFSGQCIAASIFVPENLSVESNRIRYIISAVRSQLRGTMLDSAALDRLFAVEYPEKNYVPAFQPKHGKTIAYRMEAWTDEALQLLLDSRCLFQPAYAPHRATLLIDARSGIICNGVDITHVPVVIPEPEPEPEIIQGPEVAEIPEPEVVIIEETLQADETGREGESGQDGNEGVEAAVGSSGAAELENRGSVSFSRELTGVDVTASADDGVEVVEPLEPAENEAEKEPSTEDYVVVLDEPDDAVEVLGEAEPATADDGVNNHAGVVDDGVEVVMGYPIPPNATVPPPPPEADVLARHGLADYPKNDNNPNPSYNPNPANGPMPDGNGNSFEESKRKFMLFLIFLLVGILFVFILSVSFSKKDKASEEQKVEEVSTSASSSVSYELEQPTASAEEVSLNQKIYEAYVAQLESKAAEVNADAGGLCEYFLFDITGDGIPELWVRSGTCEADYMLYVYRYGIGQLELMHSTGAGHSSFYCGDNYVLQVMAHMGEAGWYKIELSGSGLSEELVYEESDVESSDEYAQPVEPDAQMHDYDVTWPIASALE